MINQFGGKLIKFAELLVPLKFVLGPKQGTVHLLCFNKEKNLQTKMTQGDIKQELRCKLCPQAMHIHGIY